MADPKVSVLMSVYNGEKYLREAVESILNQTFRDFEFIIIDDGSTDSTNEIIRSYSDCRIRLLENEENIGLTKSLNKGIDQCRGEYIARMDGDDVSLQHRLSKQLEYLINNPEVGVCGTQVKLINKTFEKNIELPTGHDEICAYMIFTSKLVHPSIMMRKTVLDQLDCIYNEKYRTSQDLDLWERLSKHTKLSNTSEVLFCYRNHPNQISNSNKSIDDGYYDVGKRILNDLQLNPSIKNTKLLRDMWECTRTNSRELICMTLDLAENIIIENKKKLLFDQKLIQKIFGKQWYYFCRKNTQLGVWIYNTYNYSSLYKYYAASRKERSLFMFYSLISHKNYIL